MLPFFVDDVPADLGLDAGAWDHDTLCMLLCRPDPASAQEPQPGTCHDLDIA
ncbi:MAG: hypothetical protein JSS14_18230 [Proteobacteria bacterium]|nr:hypothetical protein [Pseudomonadota bacterium]